MATTNTAKVAGTSTSWHVVVLWFLGGVAMLALADPAPGIATALVGSIIVGVLLNNWSIYAKYLGAPGAASGAAINAPTRAA